MQRRQFIKATTALVGASLFPTLAARAAAARPILAQLKPIQSIDENTTRSWLGESFWANRLQDWQLKNGRFECLRGSKGDEVRTISLLTHSLSKQHKPARIRVKVGLLTPNKQGFCGFILGAGGNELDYRGRALVQRAGGVNGGFMAVMDEQGELSFRDFSNDEAPMLYERIKRAPTLNIGKVGRREIYLDCHIDPVNNEKFDVRLVATDANTKKELGFIVRTSVPANELVGGVLLLSSPPRQRVGAKWWLSDIAAGGEKITVNKTCQLGPVMGCMYSLNKNILKLTAQFMPISLRDNSTARLDYKKSGSVNWITGPVSVIEVGYVAEFRVDTWQADNKFDYRIVYSNDEKQALFSGTIVKDPGNSRPLKIAMHSCIIPTSKSLDGGVYKKRLKAEKVCGRYTKDNILFPHAEMTNHCDSIEPDLYVFSGDQYYEHFPTRTERHTKNRKLDTLYRWYLWYWTYRDVVRNRPSIMLVDDHDVLQGNLWGNGGEGSELKTEEEGGFKWDKSLVRMVYRMQNGHNPDAYDPTPIKYDIPVTYGSFVYGGVSFAIVEDRKFKSATEWSKPLTTTGHLLGVRQENFLKAWQSMDKGMPKICIAASVWGSPQTKGKAIPLLDYDSNGYPFDGRNRANQLLKDAGAIALVGDQHLAMLTRQGLDDYDDGPLFFAGPAAASFWIRWFEGGNKLNNQVNGDKNTGDFIDTFGNKMRVLAVANPKISYDDFFDGKDTPDHRMDDRSLKSEGYGIVHVDHEKQTYQFDCWPWDENPQTGKQFSGWPFVMPFEKPGL